MFVVSTLIGQIRLAVHRQLDPEAWAGGGFSPANWAVMIGIFLLIFLAILSTEPSVMGPHRAVVLAVEHAILAAFAAEYAARIWSIGLNPRFSGVRGTFRYMVTPSALADLLVILPLFLSLPPAWTPVLRLLRVLRLIRLASMPRVRQAFAEFGLALAAKRFEFLLTAVIALALLLTSSTILYLVEGATQPDAFGSVPRAVWWSVVTFTTVGYGDAVPVTGLGRVFAGLFAVLGIALVAMFTGIVASALSDASRRHSVQRENGDG